MAKKIIWTQKANLERKEILEYWINRNKSKNFSIKLNKLIVETLRNTSLNPNIGRNSDIENVKIKIIRDYLLFYEVHIDEIVVLCIWDGRRNPTKLKIK
jgi:plasmid stabilization system protein ParE